MAFAVTPETVPTNADELQACMEDPLWRLSNLYWIMVKGDDGEDDLVVKFKPNRAQRRFIARIWHRNVLLKARQLGFTTLVCLLWLDCALFVDNMRCGIIAHNRESAEAIFRDKVKFAYDRLPDDIKAARPLIKDSASELHFSNNSVIRVGTSMRSGTYHRLHISELGKIAAEAPIKAKEVMTGSIPTVPQTGVLIVESTAEGRDGDFYELCQRAMAVRQSGKELTPRDYRMHFFPWHDDPNYRMDPAGVAISEVDREYFAKVEAATGKTIDPAQRAWYIATRDNDFRNNHERMWQEFPSTEEEAFQVSTEGCYYTQQLALARKEGRIGRVPYDPRYPVNTFWDIGKRDATAIWFHQRIGLQDRFLKYYEAPDQNWAHFVSVIRATGWVLGTHYLPHDAANERQEANRITTVERILNELGLQNTYVVDKTDDVYLHGIMPTRDAFATCYIDETGCKEGIVHLEMYRKTWLRQQGMWSNQPYHDTHSNGADAFRQFGQVYHLLRAEATNAKQRRRRPARNWKVA